MKKLRVFVLALTLVLALLGCGSTTDIQEPPLTITSNSESVTPYLHFAYSRDWDENGFTYSDGAELITVLAELEADGCIPRLEYSHDFDVVLGEDVTISHILLYDETFHPLDMIWDIADLSKLDAGNYYIGIVATKDGKYIEEANETEYVGWACVVRLQVNESPKS